LHLRNEFPKRGLTRLNLCLTSHQCATRLAHPLVSHLREEWGKAPPPTGPERLKQGNTRISISQMGIPPKRTDGLTAAPNQYIYNSGVTHLDVSHLTFILPFFRISQQRMEKQKEEGKEIVLANGPRVENSVQSLSSKKPADAKNYEQEDFNHRR
jgi:hypothetical protein